MIQLLRETFYFCRQQPVFSILLVFLFLLPFLDGGTHFAAETLLLILPLPFFLLGTATKEINWKKFFGWPIIFWLAFLVFVGISVINSTNQLFSIPAFFQLLGTFLFFILFLLTAGKEDLKYAVGLVLVVSFLLCLLSFYYLFPSSVKPAPMNLVYATHGHSHLADYLLLVIPLALALFLTAKKKKSRLFYGGLLTFFFINFILTFSRGAFLVLPLIILLLIFLLKPKTIAKKLASWLLVLIPIGLLLLILFFSLSSFGLEAKLSQPQHWLVKQLVKPEFQAKRLEYWQQALEGFRTRPLFGFGWGSFEIVALRFQRSTAGWSNYTHNFYLQTLAEAGIFAVLSFLGFLFLSLQRIWQLLMKNKRSPFLLGGLGAIVASCLHSLLDYDWHFPAVFLTFLFLLANLLAWRYQNNKKILSLKLTKGLLIGLSILVFGFGWVQLAGEYFYQIGDYQKTLILSPWPVVSARKMGDKIFEKDFAQGEEIGQKLISLSTQDPSMNYWLADKYYYRGEPGKAAEYYQKAINYNPFGNHYLYQRLGEIYGQLGEEEKREKLYQSFAEKLVKTKAFQKKDDRRARDLYLIGEDYFNRGRLEEVVFWWKKAIEGAPEWSYFHLELASLYMSLVEPGQTEAVLNNCLNFFHPKEHCGQYLERLSKGEDFEPPGYWRSKILEIPKD